MSFVALFSNALGSNALIRLKSLTDTLSLLPNTTLEAMTQRR
jgi:hypothetical protein